MSLVGNLEDLGFGDILQIVSLSRKSGVFLIQDGARKAKIIFRNGEVLSAFTNFERQDLCRKLVGQGEIEAQVASAAQRRFRQNAGRLGIADCLLAESVPAAKIENTVRQEIEKVVFGIFSWSGGEFSFELKEIDEDLAKVRANPYRLIHQSGINPQFLAMEGTRLSDEAGRAESATASDPGEAFVPDEATEDLSPAKPVILVDDEPRILEVLAAALRARGYSVESFGETGAALARVSELQAGEGALCVISDLILPRMDGEGMLGGLELLERVRERNPTLPFMLITDRPQVEAKAQAGLLGVDFILAKPRSGELREDEESPALGSFLSVVDPILQDLLNPSARQVGGGDSTFDLRRALFTDGDEAAAVSGEESGAAAADSGDGLTTLRSMLCELSNPIAGGQIELLILRFAAEVMNRAVLFTASETEVTGLGQFGIEIPETNADWHVRRIQIPLRAPSVFHDVVAKRSIIRGPLEENVWNARMLGFLGGGRPADVFVAPIIAGESVVAVLYGDNLPGKSPVRNTEALEIFLSQAGLAFEKAILERQIREMKTGE